MTTVTSTPATIKTGDTVSGGRWPNASAHPDCWQRPWSGVVLADNDPRAYGPSVEPHDIARPISEYVSVLWDFGCNGTQVYWQRSAALKPYADDLADWAAARRKAYADSGRKAVA